jgi:hypothetical protein
MARGHLPGVADTCAKEGGEAVGAGEGADAGEAGGVPAWDEGRLWASERSEERKICI